MPRRSGGPALTHDPDDRRLAPGEDSLRQEKLVAHFKDGGVARGYSRDFSPDAQVFHLLFSDGEITSARKIQLDQLKALFHVKTWGSATRHSERRKGFPEEVVPEAA